MVPPTAGCESDSLVPVLFPGQLCGLLWELLTPKREMPAVALFLGLQPEYQVLPTVTVGL